MPAIGSRLNAKPFKSQRELKHKRTMATLKRYAKRRAEFLSMKLLVLAVFIFHYQPELKAMRDAKLKKQNQLTSMLRSRAYRKRKKLLKKQAQRQERLNKAAAKQRAAQARILKQQADLRKHATAHEGFRQGWCATVPIDETQMLAQSYAKRFIREYLRAVSEKARVTELMAAQHKPLPQPKIINP